MGIPKPKKSGKPKPARPPQQLSAEEHFENAVMAFAMESYERAASSFKKALELEPENPEYLEEYGAFLADVGQHPEAAAVLQKAAGLRPDEGFEKYMYLGQLLEGQEAEQAVRKGITVLRSAMQQQAAAPPPAEGSEAAEEAAAEKQVMQAQLSSCLCALAELLMNKSQGGDAGVSSVAGECETLLGEARSLADSSPEPLQALASLRQQQGKDEEALQLLRQSMALWFRPSDSSDEEEDDEEEKEEEGGGRAAARGAAQAAAAAGKGKGETDAEEEGEEELGSQDSDSEMEDMELAGGAPDDLLSYEFRFETAKLLLELDESVDAASQVLEQLLEENDQDPNVWLLLAMCCQGGGDLEGALAAAEEGLDLCRKLGLPPADEIVAGFEAMQGELQAMIEGEKKEARKAEKEKGQTK